MTGDLNCIRVVIADEHATFREAVGRFLEPAKDLMIVGEASNASDVPMLARQLKPDVVLIDVALFYRLKARMGTQLQFGTLVTVPTSKTPTSSRPSF